MQLIKSIIRKHHPRKVIRGVKSFFSNEPTIKNSGSIARDNLANERTFLAWSSTGLAFMGVGIGFHEYRESSREENIVVSGAFYACGAIFLAFATRRYFQVLNDLKDGVFRPAKRGIIGIISCTTLISSSSLLLTIYHNRQMGIQEIRSENIKKHDLLLTVNGPINAPINEFSHYTSNDGFGYFYNNTTGEWFWDPPSEYNEESGEWILCTSSNTDVVARIPASSTTKTQTSGASSICSTTTKEDDVRIVRAT